MKKALDEVMYALLRCAAQCTFTRVTQLRKPIAVKRGMDESKGRSTVSRTRRRTAQVPGNDAGMTDDGRRVTKTKRVEVCWLCAPGFIIPFRAGKAKR